MTLKAKIEKPLHYSAFLLQPDHGKPLAFVSEKIPEEDGLLKMHYLVCCFI